MSSARVSTARSRVTGHVAPTYEPMEYSLTSKAQRDLALLSRQHNLRDLTEHIRFAQNVLTEYAADINEKAYWKKHEVQQRRRRAENQRKRMKTQAGEEDDDDDEILQTLEESNAAFASKVQSMTRRMDESMRKTIDGAHSVEDLKECLEFTTSDAVQNSQRVLLARSQAQAQNEEDDDDGEEDVTQITATGRSRAAGRQDKVPLGTEPTKTLRDRLDRSKVKYQSLSLASRYSQHPTYVEFKRAVHDAQYDPENIPDLPPAKTWFAEAKGEPVPGSTSAGHANNGHDEASDGEDDDVAVLQSKISTKCPLTLVEFVDPVTSTACRHSFERAAIMELISRATARQPGRTGEKIVQCPVSGCSAKITASSLVKDTAILRKIQRILEHQRRVADYADEHGGEGRSGAVQLDSDDDGAAGRMGGDGARDIDDLMSDDDDEQTSRRRATIKRFKSEPRGTQQRGASQAAAIHAGAQSRGRSTRGQASSAVPLEMSEDEDMDDDEDE